MDNSRLSNSASQESMNAAASSSTLKSTPTRSAAASTASKSASASAEGGEEVACDKAWMPGALQRNLFFGG